MKKQPGVVLISLGPFQSSETRQNLFIAKNIVFFRETYNTLHVNVKVHFLPKITVLERFWP